jgi:hypothetical protein
MKPQTIYKGLALLALSFTFVSCFDSDWDTPDMTNPPYGNNEIVEDQAKQVTIADLKAKYSKAIANSSFERITDELQLRATVIGNDIGGNIYKQIIVQDATGALVVGINGTGLFPFLSVGQQLLIDLKDLCIGGYGEQPQLGDEYNNSIGRMSTEKWEQHVRILPSHDISQIDTIDFFKVAQADIDRYSGHLVKLENVTIGDAGSPIAPEYKAGTPLIYNGSTNGYVHHTINGQSMSKLLLRTSTYADFASWVIPSHQVTLYGIATRYRDTWQILIRAEDDIKSEK